MRSFFLLYLFQSLRINFNIESMNEKITMSEFLPIILESIQGVQNQLNEFQKEFSDFKIEVDRRFDMVDRRFERIESTMVKKNDFNHLFRSLTRVLSEKDLLSETESRYFLSQTQD